MNQATILLVDDNTTNLNVLLDYLHEHAYNVLIALNGEQALQQIAHIRPDIILLDVMMPGIDGFETCRRLKADATSADIPVIFMTALTETVDKIAGFSAGGVDYITKPFQPEEVLARVKTHLTIQNLRRELGTKNATLEKYTSLLEIKNTELDEKNLELKLLNADKDKFFSIIAHDLRNPLGALRELPQIIIENIENYSTDELIRMISMQREAAQNLFALLENLLTWSRLQRGMIGLEPQQLDIIELARRNITLMNMTAEQKGISLTNSVQDHTVVCADYKMIDTVLRNLITNAIKFTKSGGSIDISASLNGSNVEIAVRDTGIGISEHNLPKLFRIEERYKKVGTANERGTGLGLILCKEFVERHGSKIWVESEPGKGSTFTFSLPVEEVTKVS